MKTYKQLLEKITSRDAKINREYKAITDPKKPSEKDLINGLRIPPA